MNLTHELKVVSNFREGATVPKIPLFLDEKRP